MSELVDTRLQRLRGELDDHARIADHLGLDLERPLRSLNDGYPENAVALVGKLTEKLLKELWRHHGVAGDPSSRALNDLVKGCRPFVRSGKVLNALEDIRRLRNRSTHDGYDISEEDGLLAVRRLVDVLVWFTDTGSAALTGGEPRMAPEVARRCEFLAGLYLTLGYRQAKRFVLTPDTVYQLFCREAGMRLEYVELMLSQDEADLRSVLTSAGGELLRTRLPKLTRFVILDEEDGDAALPDPLRELLGQDCRIIRYDSFVGTLIDVDAHLASAAQVDSDAPPHLAITANVLSTDPLTSEAQLQGTEDAAALLNDLARRQANVLVVGRPGSGKSTLLRALAAYPDGRRFRFYFDLGLKPKDMPFPEYVAGRLGPFMRADRSRAYDLFLYLIRSGTALCALDAVDEGVDEASPAGFLRLFADLAPVLSAESAVVMGSRVSFLADSPPVRQLLDRGAARSEQLVEQMYANGVDPNRVPHFHLVRLAEPDATPLEKRLARELRADDLPPFGELLGKHIHLTLADSDRTAIEGKLPEVFGDAFLQGRSVFTLLELHRALGPDAFTDGRPGLDSCVLRQLLRPAGPDQVAFVHSAYQELLAARSLATREGRERAGGMAQEAYLTEQVRAFLARIPAAASAAEDCVLPAGVHVVGPAERLLLRTVRRPVRFDRYAVTVSRYRAFLDALRPDGTSRWDHPEQPAGITHFPWRERLRKADYYADPRFADHPAICVSWWSAFAFAAFEGKRLPTALEWEAAARGTDGRLFPWGDEPDGASVNCADTWVGRPLVTFQEWQRDFAQDALREAWVTPVDERPANRSPYGITDMVGNVWEWTSTTLDDPGEAVICGGSYDNPLRAVQAGSKGVFRKRGGSNVVGFRCVQDVPAGTGVTRWGALDE